MNRAFKTIWNEARRAYVVTNEAQKTHAKPTKSAVVLAIAATALFSGVASAAYVEQGQLGSTASWETAEYQKDHGLAYINASTAYAEGYTGKGVLTGVLPATINLDEAPKVLEDIKTRHKLRLPSGREIDFDPARDVILSPEKIAIYHTNAIHVIAQDENGAILLARRYYSIGGGFIVESDPDNFDKVSEDKETKHKTPQPYPIDSAADLLRWCHETGLSIPEVVRANERAWKTDEQIDRELDYIWQMMKDCVARGLKAEGVMPGPLKVKRRAKQMYEHLDFSHRTLNDPLAVLDWVNAFAFAASEQNACGGQVVTAPTNGAAGVIPAVLHYYMKFIDNADIKGVRDFLLTAGQIGALYKENASISGAEVGCQGGSGGGLFNGFRGTGANSRSHPGTSRKRRRNRYGTSPGYDLRPGRRPSANSLHRAQCGRGSQSH